MYYRNGSRIYKRQGQYGEPVRFTDGTRVTANRAWMALYAPHLANWHLHEKDKAGVRQLVQR